MVKPLFIFSLPRSGSTLLQRVFASDRKIASVAEPWLLLPLVYSLREQGVSAEYSHKWANIALTDFFLELPNGKQDYLSAIGTATRELYQKATKNKDAMYFLDKTPRYTLIADEIFDIFPEAKFIFLWRNPLAIIASIIETWGKGKWNISSYRIDLYDGMANMIEVYKARSDAAVAVQYEAFLQSPEKELARIARYLELEFEAAVLKDFAQVSFKGKLIDPTGVKNYQAVDTAPLEKWKTVINNPLRKMCCRRYLHWLGEERLKIMGYDIKQLLSDLDSTPFTIRYVFSDGIRMLNIKARVISVLSKLWHTFFK